nr:ORF109 [Acipenserid herpesvirus 1]
MSSIIRQAKYLVPETDLPLLSDRVVCSDGAVNVYYTSTDYLTLKRVIYNNYLARFNGPPLKSDKGELYSRIIAPHLEALKSFFCYLHLHHLKEMDNEGRMVGFYQTVDDDYNIHDINEMAQFYHLKWLQSHYVAIFKETEETKRVVGPLLRRGDEIIVVGKNRLFSMGLPPHTKAFTSSNNGHTWYALTSPIPTIIELWIKTPCCNYWRMLTRAIDREMTLTSAQLTLADKTCLYMLINGRQMICYNMANYHWLKLVHHNYLTTTFTYVMSETGDESLPLTLVVNNEAGTVVIISYCSLMWTRAKNSLSTNDYLYTESILGLETTTKSEDMFDLTSVDKVQLKLNILSKRCPINKLTKMAKKKNFKRPADIPLATVPLKAIKVESLEQGLEVLRKLERPADAEEFNVDASEYDNTKYKTTKNPWVRITVSEKQLFGLKANGEWWCNQITYNVNRHASAWRLANPPLKPNDQLVWDPRYDMLAVVGFNAEAQTLGINGQERQLDLFNPNYSDQSLLLVIDSEGRYRYSPPININDNKEKEEFFTLKGGLDSLKYMQQTKDKVYHYDPKSIIPPALDLLLKNLSPNPTTYFNGGVREGPTHPLTGNPTVQLYTLDPPTTHLIQKANYDALLRRYARPEPVISLNVIGCAYDNQRPTQYITQTANRFHFYSKNKLAFLVDVIA